MGNYNHFPVIEKSVWRNWLRYPFCFHIRKEAVYRTVCNHIRTSAKQIRVRLSSKKWQRPYRFAAETLLIGSLFAMVSYQTISWDVRYESDFEYCLLWFLSLILGVFTPPRTKYNVTTIVGIMIVPFVLDYLMAYHRNHFLSVLSLCLWGLCVYSVIVLWQFCQGAGKCHNRKKWPRYVLSFVYRSKLLMTAILVLSLLVLSVSSAISGYVTRKEQEKVVYTDTINSILSTMDNNVEAVSRLESSCWNALPKNHRLATIQEIIDIECKYLGIPYPLTIELKEMSDESILGSYSHKNKTIHINKNVFAEASGKFLLSILLHEVYHAYQNTILDVYEDTADEYRNLIIFEKAPTYSNEFEHYISGVNDYEAYSKQLVEQDSEAYSMLRGQDYITLLNYIGACKDENLN